MSPRIYERKFDWDEAKRLRDGGMSWAALAGHFGVSPGAIRRILAPGLKERMNAAAAEWQRVNRAWVGTCPDCGGPATRVRSETRIRNGRCMQCATRVRAVTVRADSLQCSACRLWLTDDEFPHNATKKSRRGRHALCRPCQTAARQLHRESNREQQRAYDRDRRRRVRTTS